MTMIHERRARPRRAQVKPCAIYQQSSLLPSPTAMATTYDGDGDHERDHGSIGWTSSQLCCRTYSAGAGDHAQRPAAQPSRMSRPTTSPAGLRRTAPASARNSLARIRTVTRWPAGGSTGAGVASAGGVHGCTAAADLVVSAFLNHHHDDDDDLDAQLPMHGPTMTGDAQAGQQISSSFLREID
ncbi:hypothetical protein U9M48_041176 [Paspalum notatum var. saurae]|uniref:Uncharacterized protein n=1 Tax=Paspalum notatum var. saurae TaxID=547442 RepID=A0AAQ3UPZ1_PASNO